MVLTSSILLAQSDDKILLDKILNYKPVKVDGGKWIKELRENWY